MKPRFVIVVNSSTFVANTSTMNILKSSAKLVAEIHNEFDTAQDRLLQEAKSIIGNANEDYIYRLHQVGFVNTPQAKKHSSLVKSKEQADLIAYYKQHYPFQKFLTEDELDRICTKYNLIYAPIANYIKDVPQKNLKDIQNAKGLTSEYDVSVVYFVQLEKKYVLGTCPTEIAQKLVNGFYSGSPINNNINGCIKKTFGVVNEYYKWNMFNYKETIINKQGYFIAAPKSHFNIEGLKKEGKFGFMNLIVTEVKDPIVFRYCKGGIQVLTKWGLEASDELLTNPIEN